MGGRGDRNLGDGYQQPGAAEGHEEFEQHLHRRCCTEHEEQRPAGKGKAGGSWYVEQDVEHDGGHTCGGSRR